MERPAIEIFTRSKKAMGRMANIQPMRIQRTRPRSRLSIFAETRYLAEVIISPTSFAVRLDRRIELYADGRSQLHHGTAWCEVARFRINAEANDVVRVLIGRK